MSSDHREHVHGEWPVNTTGRPEPILTAKQWQDIRHIADRNK